MPLRTGSIALLLAAVATAATAADPAVTDSSYRTASGERVLELSTVVPAPLAAVWAAFTTEDGFRRWAAPFARIDFRVGGEYEASYNAAARPGAPDNIRNAIVAVVPQRLVVIRNVQAPPKAPFDVEAFQKTLTAVHFAPVDDRSTRVTLQNAGYLEGAGFDSAYRHFVKGNTWTLDQLRLLFERR